MDSFMKVVRTCAWVGVLTAGLVQTAWAQGYAGMGVGNKLHPVAYSMADEVDQPGTYDGRLASYFIGGKPSQATAIEFEYLDVTARVRGYGLYGLAGLPLGAFFPYGRIGISNFGNDKWSTTGASLGLGMEIGSPQAALRVNATAYPYDLPGGMGSGYYWTLTVGGLVRF